MKKELKLFDMPTDKEKSWEGMPHFNQQNKMPVKTIMVHFENIENQKAFEKLMNQRITRLTKSIWFPKAEKGTTISIESSESVFLHEHPIYIISKGRWETRLTSKALDKIGVNYKIVIEPQEYHKYASVIERNKILTLPFSNLGQGSIPARNWVWEHSIEKGDYRHWILDDNIRSFMTLIENKKTKVSSGNIFAKAEQFVDRYENVAMSGFNYQWLCKQKQKIPPFYLNTRIYSCILIQNDIPFKWRGIYNEDTDLSLRVLKAKYCTVLFNAFLADKQTTMSMVGGNTEDLYEDNGRLKMAESLREQHPDVVKVSKKWGRDQHHVDYSIFKKNKLIFNKNTTIGDNISNVGTELTSSLF